MYIYRFKVHNTLYISLNLLSFNIGSKKEREGTPSEGGRIEKEGTGNKYVEWHLHLLLLVFFGLTRGQIFWIYRLADMSLGDRYSGQDIFDALLLKV